MEGWISLYRSIKEHWIWDNPIKFQWWIDILLSVNHTPKKVNIGNDLILCEKGQSIASLQTWGKRWNVSKDTVRNFLKLLENDKMITLENLKKTTRITVCKYDSYQKGLHVKQTTSKRKPNTNQTQTDPNNNENNENNGNKENKKELSDFEIAFNDFKEMRKRLKKPLTEKAEEIAIKKLNSLSSNQDIQIKILEQSTFNSWQGLFELKEDKKPKFNFN